MDSETITGQLLAVRAGGSDARERLFTSVYDQLKALARRQLRLRGRTPTLGATALVHEAYLRLIDQTQTTWKDRGHFFAVAARAMRQIAIDHARRRGTAKRGDGSVRLPLDPDIAAEAAPLDDVLAVDAALQRLGEASPRLVETVELLFFAGLTIEEAAEALSTSPSTVKRDWRKAKALLLAFLGEGGSPSHDD